MVLRPGRPTRSTAKAATGMAATETKTTSRVGQTWPTRPAARTSAGIVATSPTAVTNGAVTLSGSQPKRTDPAVRARAVMSTAAEASRPPRTLMRMKAPSVIESAMPNTSAAPLASTASTTEVANVRISDAKTFSPTTDEGRNVSRKVPAWIAVPRRDPSAPKMFPRRAIAAGTISNRPGSSSSRAVLCPSVRPASKATTTNSRSATRRSPISPSAGNEARRSR